MTQPPDPPTVYRCIAAVSAEIAQTGISKSRNNATQGYQFRGIDDVYNALAPVMAKHGLVILPRMLSRETTERPSKNGGVLFTTVIAAEFDFVSSWDGSIHTTRAYGEAMDTADKSTNKAMSAAYKYTAMQTFCIPTEGDNDADAGHHEPSTVAAPPAHNASAKSEPQAIPQAWQRFTPPPEAVAANLTPPARRAVANGHGADLTISERQANRLYAIAGANGWTKLEVQGWLKNKWGYESAMEIPKAQIYESIIEGLKGEVEP